MFRRVAASLILSGCGCRVRFRLVLGLLCSWLTRGAFEVVLGAYSWRPWGFLVGVRMCFRPPVVFALYSGGIRDGFSRARSLSIEGVGIARSALRVSQGGLLLGYP